MNEAWATHTVGIECYIDLNPDVRTIDVASLITEPMMCCNCGEMVHAAVTMRAAMASMPHCTMPEIGAEA